MYIYLSIFYDFNIDFHAGFFFLFLFVLPVNDKSSVAGDPLTDPGEYENLPFHGMQSAPNKVSHFYFAQYLSRFILSYARI